MTEEEEDERLHRQSSSGRQQPPSPGPPDHQHQHEDPPARQGSDLPAEQQQAEEDDGFVELRRRDQQQRDQQQRPQQQQLLVDDDAGVAYHEAATTAVVNRRRRTSLKYKVQLFCVVALSICAFLLFCYERYLTYSLERRRLSKAADAAVKLRKKKDTGAGTSSLSTSQQSSKTTMKSSTHLELSQLHLNRRTTSTPYEMDVKTMYWNRAVALLDLHDWDPTIRRGGASRVLSRHPYDDHDDDATIEAIRAASGHLWPSSSSSGGGNDADRRRTLEGLAALERAADEGHPLAQKHVGVALASGYWPATYQPETVAEGDDGSGDDDDRSNDASRPLLSKLEVQQDMVDPTSHQQQKAMLLWQMAAIGGDAEAAMIVLNRLENYHHSDDDKLRCEEKLPYYRAVADAIVDSLETNPQSRGRVAPTMDKHVLHQLHLFGGTQSKLDTHNQPDESEQALQFYHVRAMDQAANEAAAASASSSSSEGIRSDASQTTGSAAASFTLAQLYHYGLRGVPQNLTQALYYYEFAARQGHWEAAGLAGEFYFWGIGVEKDPYHARKLWKQGMPFGIDGCRKRLDQKLRNPKQGASANLCDSQCLNGMGLLLILGLPIMVQVDIELAEKHFQLAREQGNKDAFYHLAMMKLGWKTHFVSLEGLEHLQDGGQTRIDKEHHFPTTKKGQPMFHPSHSEWTQILSELNAAASGGHLQAKHRLGDMYSNGVTAFHRGNNVVVVPKDCEKATKSFKWIIEQTSPHRSQRLRNAYKQYMAGNVAASLRNYLVAAEAGSDLAQVNAAFLLEQGECLGMSPVDCAKASVRLWKAAAARGNAEASLRVGDFYYYGRFREGSHEGVIGPFGFVQYFLYPEKFVGKLLAWLENAARSAIMPEPSQQSSDEESTSTASCSAENAGEGSCSSGLDEVDDDRSPTSRVEDGGGDDDSVQYDLEMSARYYRQVPSSPRANFNLGFQYEWGLGLKQDFPLAKRHYDLAMDNGSSESELPILIALLSLKVHETMVKRWMSWMDRLEDFRSRRRRADEGDAGFSFSSNDPQKTSGSSQRFSNGNKRITTMDVIVHHLLSWESVLVLVLTGLLWVLMQLRQRRRTRR